METNIIYAALTKVITHSCSLEQIGLVLRSLNEIFEVKKEEFGNWAERDIITVDINIFAAM